MKRKEEGWNFEGKAEYDALAIGRKLKRKVGMRFRKRGLTFTDRATENYIKRWSIFSEENRHLGSKTKRVHVHPGNNASTRIPHSFDRCL